MIENKTTIIAELCQNHLGRRDLIEEMIIKAAKAGATFVKIQTIRADYLSKRDRFEEGVTQKGITKVIKRPFQAEFDRLKKLDIDMDDHDWFIGKCHENNVKAMTTIFNKGVVDALSELKWDAIKVASYDCASFALLEKLKSKFKKLYVSTGATFDKEIEQAAKILDGVDFSFLHCVTIYPTPIEKVDLSRMDYLRKFSDTVGFSDHTLVSRDGIKASIGALFYGANIIERHFTVLEEEKTKDGPISINPHQLKRLVEISNYSLEELKNYVYENVPEYERMIGKPNRALSDEELLNRDYYRGRFITKTDEGEEVYNWD